MEKRIGVVRRPEGLYARILREERAQKIAPTELNERLGLEACRFRITEQPLDSVAAFQYPQLQNAWKHLQHVVRPDADTLTQIGIVLGQTIAPELPSAVLPPLDWELADHTALIRPTAAHPRAYRGTKYQPPRAKLPSGIDLQPYLCDRRGVAMLLQSLSLHRAEANRRLKQAGHPPLPWQEECEIDTTTHHTAISPIREPLPPTFRQDLFPLLAGQDGSVVTAWLSLFWKLDLARDPDLRQAITCLLCLQPTAYALHWCEQIVTLPTEWRLTFTLLLLETEVYGVDPQSLSSEDYLRFQIAVTRSWPAYRLYCLLRAVAKGIALDYVETGQRLGGESLPVRCSEIERSGYFPEAAALSLPEHLYCEDNTSRDCHRVLEHSYRLWECCGLLQGLGHLIETIDWKRYSPQVAAEYFELYVGFAWERELSLSERDAKWKPLAAVAARFTAVLEAASIEYQHKCAHSLRTISWFFEEEKDFHACLNYALELVARIVRPPFSTNCNRDQILFTMLLKLKDPERNRLLSASDNSLLKLEAAGRSSNSAWLIEAGIQSLCYTLGAFTVDCFLQLPAKLCRVAKRLGSLSDALRDQVVRETAKLPLFTVDILSTTPEEQRQWLERIRAKSLSNPIPIPLLRHLQGERQLPPTQVAHHQKRMRERLLLMRLEMLEQQAIRTLSKGFEPIHQCEAGIHALQMRGTVHENRRAFRKFLRAYQAGIENYSESHPLTQKWLRQHPSLNTAIWCQGLVCEGECPEHGPIRISIETDPLEVLKLGTYVGSCLGLGGGFTYSAAAVVLDINKQVLYARNAKGQVVARQLVAISEAEELVCFSVYPLLTGKHLKRLFAEADTTLERRLNLPRFTPGDDREYDIACILSHNWWDDYIWQNESIGKKNPQAKN